MGKLMSTYIWLMAETGFGTMVSGALVVLAVIGGLWVLSRERHDGDN